MRPLALALNAALSLVVGTMERAELSPTRVSIAAGIKLRHYIGFSIPVPYGVTAASRRSRRHIGSLRWGDDSTALAAAAKGFSASVRQSSPAKQAMARIAMDAIAACQAMRLLTTEMNDHVVAPFECNVSNQICCQRSLSFPFFSTANPLLALGASPITTANYCRKAR